MERRDGHNGYDANCIICERLVGARECDASTCPGDLMITRRCMLVASSGLAAMVAAKPAASETPTAQPRNATMEITRNGSQPSRKGPTEYFTGSVLFDPLFQAPEPARVTSASVTFEAGARTRLAHTSARSDLDHHVGS